MKKTFINMICFVLIVGMTCFTASTASAQITFPNNPYQISVSDGQNNGHTMCYNPTRNEYLVAYMSFPTTSRRVIQYFRLDSTGTKIGGPVDVIDDLEGSSGPSVCYNSARQEYLISYQGYTSAGGLHSELRIQRVNAINGALIGASTWIRNSPTVIATKVAYSPTSDSYLLVWEDQATVPWPVYGLRLNSTAGSVGSIFNISNGTYKYAGDPAIAHNSVNNEYLVTFNTYYEPDPGNTCWNLFAQRVRASDGALLGGNITIGATTECESGASVAYDSNMNRYLVVYEGGATRPWGQFVSNTGTLVGARFDIGVGAFNGGMSGVAWNSLTREWFVTWASCCSADNYALRLTQTGSPIGNPLPLTGAVQGFGNWDPLPVYNSVNNEVLICWFWQYAIVYVRRAAAPPGPVTNFAASSSSGQNLLSWTNPSDPGFTGTLIRYRTDTYPASPEDGTMVVDKLNAAGSNDAFAHTSLTNWTTYYYSAFAHDIGPNYSLVAQAAATPRPAVVTISSSEFTSDADGWTLETWQSGPGLPGTIAQDAATGSMVSTGNGQSNNRDACLREGSIMTRAISTIGRSSIQVEYDVMTSLHSPPTGSPSGGCTVLEGSIEDKLVVYYSTAGTSGPWTVGQILSEGVELPTGWTRKLINLAGVSAVSNNADFALRFQWQFNSTNDMGRVDNVRVLSGAVTAPVPDLGLSTTSIERTVQAGQNLPNDILRVNNTGEGVLNFTVSENAPWLGASPTDGSSAGPEVTILLGYTTAGLGVGDYEATLQVASVNALNSPQAVAVKLHVIPAVCFWEPFAYYDGDLTKFGSANWSGSATDQIQVESGVLKVFGGAGVVNAAHSVSCAGSNGVIAAQIKIKRGTGSGDFFWNIALDDASANNLARWYGGSTIARGRVGSTITPDMLLTSPTTWDDLYVKIDTAANTSTFFFNGVSFGSISHGTTPANSVGSIRLERLDRFSAVGNTIYFDNLTVGSVDLTPPHLDSIRSGNTLILSWPATGTGAQLELAPTLSPPIQWSAVTNPLGLTNGHRTFATNVTSGSGFFRLMKQP